MEDINNNSLLTNKLSIKHTGKEQYSNNCIDVNNNLEQSLEEWRVKSESLYNALVEKNVSKCFAYLATRKLYYGTFKIVNWLNDFANSIENGKLIENINKDKLENDPIYYNSTYGLTPSFNELYKDEISEDDNNNIDFQVYKDAQRVKYPVNIIKKYSKEFLPEFNIDKYNNCEFITLKELLRELATVTYKLSSKVINDINKLLQTNNNARNLEYVIDTTLCPWINTIMRMLARNIIKKPIKSVNKDIWTELDNKRYYAIQPIAETGGDLRKLRNLKDSGWI